MYIITRRQDLEWLRSLCREPIRMARGPNADNPRNVVVEKFAIITLTDGTFAIELEALEQPMDLGRIHSDYDPSRMSAVIGAELTLLERTAMEAAITARKGDFVRQRDVIPFDKLGAVKTRQELEQEGKWPVADEPPGR